MSQDFELKFDEYKESNPTNKEEGDNNQPDFYPSTVNNRNLVFILSDSKMQFFNYSYLITASYNPDNGSILMVFTTHHITLKGEQLESLFFELMMQSNKIIRCIDKRYRTLALSGKYYIDSIKISDKQ